MSDEFHSVPVKIEKGLTLKQVSNRLKEKELIRSSLAFQLVAYLRGRQDKIQAGEFALSPSMPPLELLEIITSGKVISYKITIPEGLRISEIAKLLSEKKLACEKEIINWSHNKELMDSLEIHGKSLEGYLFPDTYTFDKSASAKEIIQKMAKTFLKKGMRPGYKKRAQELGFDFNQIVTLASIIEKETGQASERRKISSVFHNRLKKNMRLQSDPTVIYAIPNFDGNIHKRDLSIKSPYNTYKVKGLPPGPIANPGHASINAALFPETSKHLYFVSRKNGSHQFSDNLKDHNRAVRKYQLKKSTTR